MPDQETLARVREDQREGKSASTQAGEFVREEIEHVRGGKHGARSPQQAVAIGLSKARRAGVKLPPPKGPGSVREKAEQDSRAASRSTKRKSAKRSRASETALKREPQGTTSKKSLSALAKKTAAKRGSTARKATARKAAQTRRAA
jgi:hypothetical protein